MARRRRAEVRQLQPDLVYGDVLVTAFINKIMRDGKKNLAARIFYDACKIIQEKTKRFLKLPHPITIISMGGLSSKNNKSELRTYKETELVL